MTCGVTTFTRVVSPYATALSADVILVQSLDGLWTVIENCHESFSKTIPNFMLPGPLVYVPATDLIVTFSSLMQVEAYR